MAGACTCVRASRRTLHIVLNSTLNVSYISTLQIVPMVPIENAASAANKNDLPFPQCFSLKFENAPVIYICTFHLTVPDTYLCPNPGFVLIVLNCLKEGYRRRNRDMTSPRALMYIIPNRQNFHDLQHVWSMRGIRIANSLSRLETSRRR